MTRRPLEDHVHDTDPTAAGRVTPASRPAPTDREILPVLAERWSARAIDRTRTVSSAQVATLLEAARWAPSSGNAQPWRYLVFDERIPAAREQARDCLRRGNAWARLAPVLLLSVVELFWPDGDDRNPMAHHDVGAASMALCVQAVADGLVAHQMAGFDADRARELFGIGDRAAPVAMIAIGYPGAIGVLDERRRSRETAPRRRRPVTEIARLGGCDGPVFTA